MVNLKEASALDYLRFVFSALLLLFSMVITIYAIIFTKTNFWHQAPGWVAIILFILDLFWLGVVEGLMIAMVELKKQNPDSYKNSHPRAYSIGEIAAKGDNVERFLMGRQVFVVFLVFFAAKLTTIHLEEGEGFLFPVPGWFQAAFLETGLLACVVVVILAQLMPQIVAAKYPVHFLQIFIMRPAYYACIFLEMTGLTHICWVLSYIMSCVFGMKESCDLEGAPELLRKVETSLDRSSLNEGKNSNQRVDFSYPDTASSELMKNQTNFSNLVIKLNETVDSDTLKVIRHYLDTHPENVHQFPSVVGNKMYPSPSAIADEIKNHGCEPPAFLTDISDPKHVPPHIVACELLLQNEQLCFEIDQLRRKFRV